MIPNARFKELLRDIEPSPTTKSDSSDAHTNVRKHLRNHEAFKDRREGDFLAGSYSRDTAIRPKKSGDGYERPDVDIIVDTSFEASDHPDDVLNELGDALGDGFNVERINKRSVRLLTSKAEIDVVPVIQWGGAYLIPDRELEHWKPTNPPAHNSWSQDQNDLFDGRFKPLVKLFKSWRRENKTGKRPKGFVLEVLVAVHAPWGEQHYGEAFAVLLKNIADSYAGLADEDRKPFIEDPGLPGNDILSKVSITDWKNFLQRVRTHARYARQAQDTDDMDEATRLWRKLFGDRFRKTEKSRAESMTTYASAPAAVGTGYTFPDKPAAPNKPRGFA